MPDIRTPDDEISTPGYFYPPFKEGWWYQGATYAGHHDFCVDWNRRTKTGGWLDDTGDPVLAAADGRVATVIVSDGLVEIDHWDRTYRTEYRHMTGITVKVGQKVERGEQIGNIGNVAGDGSSFGSHLHHCHWKKSGDGFVRIKQRFYDKPIRPSTMSDKRPEGWVPPAPEMIQGPPPKATWKSAYKEAEKVIGTLTADLQSANDRIAILESAQAPDLTAVKREARQSFKDEVLALPA